MGNVVHELEHANGGHLIAHEKPDALAADLRAMFGKGGPAFGVIWPQLICTHSSFTAFSMGSILHDEDWECGTALADLDAHSVRSRLQRASHILTSSRQ